MFRNICLLELRYILSHYMLKIKMENSNSATLSVRITIQHF